MFHVNRSRTTPLFLALVILGGVRQLTGQELQIRIIDFYGLGRVSESEARQALTFKEGDMISLVGDERPAALAESERRLSTLSGVRRAHTNLVCCDKGRGIVYVGIEEQGRATTHFRAAPRGSVSLAGDIVQAGNEFWQAFLAAVQRGDAMEDDSQGHVLLNGSTTYVNLTLEYRFSQRWLVAALALHRTDTMRTIDGLNVQPTVDSQEHLNRFTFSGKGLRNYVMLASTVVVMVFIVGTLVTLWRTRVPRRKWLWALFVAIGIGQVTLNWTTGGIAIQPLQVSLLGAGFSRPGLYGPWFLSLGVPIGAVIFLLRRRQ
jgi:hypothetical protein